MPNVQYAFYYNAQKDEKGRRDCWEGFQSGHDLQLAHTGEIDMSVNEHTTLQELFDLYNIGNPTGYRGPSMSVGDVITLYKQVPGQVVPFYVRHFFVASFGFKPAEIGESQVLPTDPRWRM